MKLLIHRALSLSVAALMIAPGTVAAQAAQCSIEYGKPGQVKDANNALAKVALFAGKPAEINSAIREALSKIQKDEAKVIAQNPVGRSMVLGNIYAELAAMPENQAPVNRGSIGLVANPTGTVDLVAAADSMYDAVEAAQPACREETEAGRRKVYAQLVNEAVNQYNRQQADSALSLAMRGLAVYDGYPLSYIAYNIRGNALQSKDDLEGATAAFLRMAELMKSGDTSLVEERKNTMLSVANLMLAHAEALEADAKTRKVQNAIAHLEGYLREFPGDAKAEGVLARAQIMSGDEAAAARVFGAMAANPDKYSDAQLFETGVNAARADKSKEATALFEAGLRKNPWSRDALFNIAITLQKEEKFDEAEKHLRKLVTVDPENPEVYQVFALNFRGLVEIAKKAADKKPATSPEAKAYAALNDSLLAYYTRFSEAPVKVTFNLWSPEGGKNVLAGNIENLTDAEKSYALKFDFLDATGNVVVSKEVPVPAVAAKSAKSFRVEADGEGVVAFRYAPLK
ncbi:MAG: tetratricopeptide repeat protein [Gemmatimonadota bacterium]